jgi:hypothetical protein
MEPEGIITGNGTRDVTSHTENLQTFPRRYDYKVSLAYNIAP